MNRIKFLNIGCGNKFHKEWFNVDMTSNSPYVKSYNLLKGLPYEDSQFDVVYHSQVLEHFPKEKAPDLIGECFRVLKPGGIIRVVVPDLENIVSEYQKYLYENINNPNRMAEANYDWIMLEMYDQTVRNYSGGQMAEYLKQPDLINEDYITERIGFVAKSIRENFFPPKDKVSNKRTFFTILKKLPKYTNWKIKRGFSILNQSLFYSKENKIGKFRLGGEIHMWLYDQFSLSRLLKECGFERPEVKSPFKSNISQWDTYELDVKNGAVFDPTSIFMEARKPE